MGVGTRWYEVVDELRSCDRQLWSGRGGAATTFTSSDLATGRFLDVNLGGEEYVYIYTSYI